MLNRPLAKEHLLAVLHEYLIADDKIATDKLLDLIIDAVTKPTSEQPLVLQMHVEGTRANKLARMRSCDLTQDEQRFLDSIDDFRNEEGT